jgi:maleamate amidohydrolase
VSRPWDPYIGDAERATMARARFARRMGFGRRPALVAIDCQLYMVGERGIEDGKYPSSCGAAGWAAVDQTARLCAAARAAKAPVVFTRFVLDPSGNDIGVYGRKRELLQSPYWCLDGTPGAELLPELAAGSDDFVIVKKKPSAFFGTPLLSLLVDRGIDTVIVCGGATSNCVRATVFDASSYNFRTIVAEEAVMDRIPVSHAIALFDMDRQFADVVKCDDIVAYLEKLGGEQ